MHLSLKNLDNRDLVHVRLARTKTPQVSASVNRVPCSWSHADEGLRHMVKRQQTLAASMAYNSVLTLSALATLYPFCESNPVKKPDTLELNVAGSSPATGGLILHIMS